MSDQSINNTNMNSTQTKQNKKQRTVRTLDWREGFLQILSLLLQTRLSQHSSSFTQTSLTSKQLGNNKSGDTSSFSSTVSLLWLSPMIMGVAGRSPSPLLGVGISFGKHNLIGGGVVVVVVTVYTRSSSHTAFRIKS